jgi:predicted phage terminase large subunit-like protein
MNIYIVVDPAGEKKKTNDYTVMAVIGLGHDNNYYLIDGIRDRLNLTEKTKKLFELVRKYKPLNVGYEKYGLQSDIEHIRYIMEQENYRFRITELGGQVSKNDRIKGLVPVFENYRFWLPYVKLFKDYENNVKDFVKEFKSEFESFPVSIHDDVLDCIARIRDVELNTKFPKIIQENNILNTNKSKSLKDYSVI